MIAVKYGNTFLKVLDQFSIENSSREVKFNDLNVDFTGYTINDLPVKYQEIQLVEISESAKRTLPLVTNIYFTGYLESYTIPEMHNTWEDKILSMTIISPYALASLRSSSLIGTYSLKETITRIVQPLVDDGFVIKEMIVSSINVTSGYLLETVETCLNDLSNKYNFWWYIDENKNMYFYDLEYLTSKNIENRYNLNNMPAGSMSISPSMEATDYCNVINFKNVRMYVPSVLTDDLSINPLVDETTIKLSKNDKIEFNFPFDITVKNIQKSIESNALNDYADESFNEPFILQIQTSSSTINASIKLINNQLVFDNISRDTNASISSEISELFSINTDSFFSTLVTGLTYLGEDTITGTIKQISSCSGLKWTKMTFINNVEVDKCKGTVSNSGRIEKIVDLNETWRTEQELKELAVSYLKLNLTQTDELEIELDRKPDFGIGDTVYFDLEEFFTNNEYIVTDTSWNYINDDDQTWTILLRNKNYLANFIDVFRGESYNNDDEKDVNLIVVNYVNEKMFERHELAEIYSKTEYNYVNEIFLGSEVNL